MNRRAVIALVLLAILLLVVGGLIRSCWIDLNDTDDRKATYQVTPPPSTPVPIEPQAQIAVDFDLRSAKITNEKCVKVYDFDFWADSFPVYGLAAEYKGKLYLLLKTEAPIAHVDWLQPGEEIGAELSPAELPTELRLRIKASGEEYYYEAPREAISEGSFTVILDN